MSLANTAINPMSVVKTQLTPMPASILKLSGMLNDHNISQRQIADTLRLDPILAARVLRMANSPAYALERNVANLQTAVSAIGNQAIQDILLLALTRETFAPEIRNSAIGRKLWVHSLATGFAARELCSVLRMHSGEEAFSCGLLNDIGKVLLWRSDSMYYSTMLADTAHDKLYLAERDYYGFDHAQVGAIAAQSWNLPSSLCSVILYHHEPELAVEAQAITNVVNIADHLAFYKLQDVELDFEFLMSYPVVSMAVQTDQLEAVWEKVLICLDEVASTFD
jgi:HD-like signal output (HDOD) protein